ncbi:MAG: adenosylcobalamin-dependent ribonucleoside-diphosphate reductase [archaeon]
MVTILNKGSYFSNKELESARAFIGQSEEKRRVMEMDIKNRYSILDWETNAGIGYKINDTKKGKDIYFDPNARLTLEKRYLEKDAFKKVTENVLDLFARVAVNIAEADLKYNPKANIKPIAEGFLESLIHKEFVPNTPTLCNAGRALQQLSACFVLPVEDYIATDDIGENPEKQGEGIFDSLRYMSMIHKSGGGTGFNFGHLRPRSDRISTTFGTSSGPVSFIKVFDAATDGVNQGGFRRGANMGILNYNHPDIFEFVSAKERTGEFNNFNFSVGADNKFMESVENNGYFKLINPKDRKTVPLEERIWGRKNMLSKNDSEYKDLFNELVPSIVIDTDDESIINVYNNEKVGRIDNDGSALISARKLFDYMVENAWKEGCPGIIYLDRLERKNPTPHIGKIEATNPCGEQPLLPYEACNLGGINLATCVKRVGVNEEKEMQGLNIEKTYAKQASNNDTITVVDYDELKRRIDKGVHFLDNVIDMNKFPFKKIYGVVHGTRKIGLGIMGWAEMLQQLKIPYDSETAIDLAKDISHYLTTTAREKSMEIAKERGTFPYWEGSVFEKEGIKTRNATSTTIAPNGSTGMIAGVSGGIEALFKLAFIKTCMDGKKLTYISDYFVEDLKKTYKGNDLKGILNKVVEKGSIRDIEGIPEELKKIYRTAHDISPEWHIRMQGAFQNGKNEIGIDNAVSKTVNLPKEATIEDVRNSFLFSYKEGCIGTTIFRDQSKVGVYSGLEKTVELVQNEVELDPRIDKKAQAIKYKVRRINNNDSLHVIMTADLYVDDKNKKSYFLPFEAFQERAPLGDAKSVSFQQAGMDRSEILRGPDPDYAELIVRLQSASSNEEEGMGPSKIKSIEHAVGLVWEDYFLRNGIVGREKATNKLVNLIRKPNLRRVEVETEEYNSIMSQVKIVNPDEKLTVMGNNGKLGHKFICEGCGGVEYIFEAGCNHPRCSSCGEIESGGCG